MKNETAREEILTAIRSGCANLKAEAENFHKADTAGINAPDREALIEGFRRYAAEEAATSERVAGAGDVPNAVLRYLREHELPQEVLATGEIMPGGLDWSRTGELDVVDRPIRPDGDTVVTGCYAGLAEAGAVVTVSSRDCPNESQFLAATHIVVVSARRIFADYDTFWNIVSTEFSAGMPRSINWIVGPSRTADLGVPSRLGAHGPVRLHLIIVDK